MASYSSRFASFPLEQRTISVIILLVALYALVFPGLAMANGSSNIKPTLQSRLVQALKEKGGFTAAATFLSAVDLNHVLPESSTILAPMDEDLTESGIQVSTFNTALPILQYHVITRRLAFSDLQQLRTGETIETLLQNSTIIITSNSSSNFSVDDVPLSHENLFLANNMAVHGIQGVLNLAVYGKMKNLPISQPASPLARSPADDGEPVKGPIAPSAGKGSSASGDDTESSASPAAMENQTQSSPSPSSSTGEVGFNPSLSPPITPATQVPANTSPASSSAPVSLPTTLPSEGSPKLPLNSSPVTDLSQHAHPPVFLPANCNASLVCSLFSSSSYHLKPWLAKNILCAVSGLLLARLSATAHLPLLLYMMLVLLAAAPTSGEMNVDVSEVLRNKGGFGYAATYLQALDMHKVLPNRSTVLVPTDAAIEATGLIYTTLGAALPTLKYHVVTKELSFDNLQKLPVGTTLATLLPSSSLLITNNAVSNFTVNDVLLSHPDIFCSEGTTVHGIAGVMNFSHANRPAADTSLPHLQTSPLIPPRLILPLPESAGPFAAPLPVSQAVSVHKAMTVSRLPWFVLNLAYTSCVVLSLIQLKTDSQATR